MNKTRTMLLLAALLTANLLVWVQTSVAKRSSTIGQLDLLVDIRQQIVHGYVEEPDQDKMIEAAARAMVQSLQDPYTVYFTPEETRQFTREVQGSFSGIGAEIDIHQGRVRIVSPLEESPAWKAGVMAGDIILQIDGQDTLDMRITDAVRKLTGPEGTDVIIRVRHQSGDEADITITRARINIQTVKGIWRKADNTWQYMLDPKHRIAYVRLTQFNERSEDDLRNALKKLVSEDVTGLILDLRFNPGGVLEAAVNISDMFLPQGQRIVSTKGRTVPEQVFMSTDDTLLRDQPVVVLINEGSASAAEIVSGALLDNQRAQIVGTRSFGKGSVQQVRSLGPDTGSLNPEQQLGAIKITNAYYYLPSGRNIHRRPHDDTWGVDPRDGFYVPMTTAQIREMIQRRREGEIVQGLGKGETAPQAVDPAWIEKHLADPQLAAGLETLQGKLETGNWPVVGMSDIQAHELAARRENLEKQRQFLQDKLAELQQELEELDKPTPPTGAPEVKGAMTDTQNVTSESSEKKSDEKEPQP